MNGNLVDTNVIVKLFNGDPKAIELFDSLNNVTVSVITAGELFYGAYKSTRVDENMKLFNSFLSEYPILDIDTEVSLVYGQIKSQLGKAGINIPDNDLWIASTAIKNNLILVSFDNHFKRIKGLKLDGI